MSVNRYRQEPVCACCGKRRPQKYSMFCERCWSDNPEGCRKAMSMEEYNVIHPRPCARAHAGKGNGS